MINPAAARELNRLWATGEDSADDSALRRLFAAGDVLAAERDNGLPKSLIGDLTEAGLVEQTEGGIRATVRLSSWEGLVIAHDPSDPANIRQDSVGGINSTTRTLAALTVRRPVERALDLGTGCGAHALLAARHSREVVATDVNPRALWLTDLNARLNGITNIQCREGSLFEPVAAESFDLVVGNLPFVVSPDAQYTFRDSGLPADEISRIAIEGAASALSPGGYAHILCNWVIEHGAEEPSRPLEWLASSECSAWVLHYSNESSQAYAEKWNRALLRDRPGKYLETVQRWVAYHEEIGAVAIANGAVVLHADGHRSRRVDHMEIPPQGNGGAQVERVFAAAADTEQRIWSNAVVSLVSPHGLHQLLRHQDGHYVAAEASLALEDTAGVVGQVTPQAVHVLLRMDGERTIDELSKQAAAETGLEQGPILDEAMAVCAELERRGVVDVLWRS